MPKVGVATMAHPLSSRRPADLSGPIRVERSACATIVDGDRGADHRPIASLVERAPTFPAVSRTRTVRTYEPGAACHPCTRMKWYVPHDEAWFCVVAEV